MRPPRPCAGRWRGELADSDAVVLGPATLFRLRGRERSMLVLKTPERRTTVAAVDRALRVVSDARTHTGVNFSVDVDPQ